MSNVHSMMANFTNTIDQYNTIFQTMQSMYYVYYIADKIQYIFFNTCKHTFLKSETNICQSY